MNSQERKNRQDIVLGILVAAIFGFFINIFSNFIYDLFFSSQNFLQNKNTVWFLTFVFLGFYFTEGFLEFFVYDYENQTNIKDLKFWSRYKIFIKQNFWLTKVMEKARMGYIFFVKWFLWSFYLVASMFILKDYRITVVQISITFVFQLVKAYILSKKTKTVDK